jgi:transposase
MAKSISMHVEKKSRIAAIGVDLGDRWSHWCVIDDQGEIVEEGRTATERAAFQAEFGRYERTTIAIETGTHSPWVNRELERLGHRVYVANSRKLRLIYQNRRKNDRIDARYLARLARLDPQLLAPIRHRSIQVSEHRTLLRSRDVVVAARTRLINHVRGVVKSVGSRLPSCSPDTFTTRVRQQIPETLRPAIMPLLELLRSLSTQIRAFDRTIKQIAQRHYPVTARLRQVRGVGPLTALAFVLTIEDPSRFSSSRTMGPFLGLVPGQDQSGQSSLQKRISKEGDELLRRLLVGCAQYILGPFGSDCDLRRHGMRIAARGGKNGKKRGVVAVARKLAVLLHRLWVSSAQYDPLYNARQLAA